MTATRTAKITTGTKVRQAQGRSLDIGRTGTVTTIHGSVSGDTLVTVTEEDGTEFGCYTRQLKVV